VTELDNKLEDRLKEACPRFESVLAAVEERFKVRFQREYSADMLNYEDRMHYKKTHPGPLKLQQITFTDEGETVFLCRVCCSYFQKGKIPPKSASNCLATVPVPENVRLRTYLEEALLARVLLFIKIFPLKSMPAMKGQCVVIPLDGQDILNNVESLPRLPSESGFIDILWKRKIGMKNAHLGPTKVDPTRIFDALQFLKACGNKHYLDTQSREEYEARCQAEDPNGFNIIFGQEAPEEGKLQLEFFPDGSAEPILELERYLEICEQQTEEQQYKESDVVRKFQIDYNETVCMVDKFPEAFQVDGVIQHQQELQNKDPARCVNPEGGGGEEEVGEEDYIWEEWGEEEFREESNQLHVVAPGEGKNQVNLTYCKEWDAKGFPMLHPDGLNHLQDERRKTKLSELDYFKQRLNNIDNRWRDNTHWVFSAAVYREKKDLQRNIDLGYKHGQKDTSGGEARYTLKDPFSVFQNVANTPAYHKKGKMEMMARLDNFGPFHIFFTVSCADRRWKENIISVLRERRIGVRCSVDQKQKEMYEVSK
jgi:hypothetical protein